MKDYGATMISLNQTNECPNPQDGNQITDEQQSSRSDQDINVVPSMVVSGNGGGGSTDTSSGMINNHHESGGGGNGGGGGGSLSFSEIDHHQMIIPTPTQTQAATATSSNSGRKPRGRPIGSKNKPKPPIIITRESESSMQPLILEISSGSDVIEMVTKFSIEHHLGLSILGGSGSVSNVTLGYPNSPHNATMTIPGVFEILSISGSFLSPPSQPPSSSSSSAGYNQICPSFTVTLGGCQGQVLGGIVAGPLIATDSVFLMIASFTKPVFYKLPECFDDQNDLNLQNHHQTVVVHPNHQNGNGKSVVIEGNESCPTSMSVSVYNVDNPSTSNGGRDVANGSPNPLDGHHHHHHHQVSSDPAILPWPPISRPY